MSDEQADIYMTRDELKRAAAVAAVPCRLCGALVYDRERHREWHGVSIGTVKT